MTPLPYIMALYVLGAMFVYEICQLVFTKRFSLHEKITTWLLWPFVGAFILWLLAIYYIKHMRQQCSTT